MKKIAFLAIASLTLFLLVGITAVRADETADRAREGLGLGFAGASPATSSNTENTMAASTPVVGSTTPRPKKKFIRNMVISAATCGVGIGLAANPATAAEIGLPILFGGNYLAWRLYQLHPKLSGFIQGASAAGCLAAGHGTAAHHANKAITKRPPTNPTKPPTGSTNPNAPSSNPSSTGNGSGVSSSGHGSGSGSGGGSNSGAGTGSGNSGGSGSSSSSGTGNGSATGNGAGSSSGTGSGNGSNSGAGNSSSSGSGSGSGAGSGSSSGSGSGSGSGAGSGNGSSSGSGPGSGTGSGSGSGSGSGGGSSSGSGGGSRPDPCTVRGGTDCGIGNGGINSGTSSGNPFTPPGKGGTAGSGSNH